MHAVGVNGGKTRAQEGPLLEESWGQANYVEKLTMKSQLISALSNPRIFLFVTFSDYFCTSIQTRSSDRRITVKPVCSNEMRNFSLGCGQANATRSLLVDPTKKC